MGIANKFFDKFLVEITDSEQCIDYNYYDRLVLELDKNDHFDNIVVGKNISLSMRHILVDNLPINDSVLRYLDKCNNVPCCISVVIYEGDRGKFQYRLADGRHRYIGSLLCGFEKIPCNISCSFEPYKKNKEKCTVKIKNNNENDLFDFGSLWN